MQQNQSLAQKQDQLEACVYCMEFMQLQDKKVSLKPCDHTYHKHCFAKNMILNSSHACALCRKPSWVEKKDFAQDVTGSLLENAVIESLEAKGWFAKPVENEEPVDAILDDERRIPISLNQLLWPRNGTVFLVNDENLVRIIILVNKLGWMLMPMIPQLIYSLWQDGLDVNIILYSFVMSFIAAVCLTVMMFAGGVAWDLLLTKFLQWVISRRRNAS